MTNIKGFCLKAQSHTVSTNTRKKEKNKFKFRYFYLMKVSFKVAICCLFISTKIFPLN